MSKKKAVIYCRVSTSKQSQEGESLLQQAEVCSSLAQKLNCEVSDTFTDTYSGKTLDRPGLNDLLKYVEKNDIDYVLTRDIDRVTRGGSGDYDELKKCLSGFGATLVDSYGFIQPPKNILEQYGLEGVRYDWSEVSPTDMAEKVRADMAEEERKVILRRVVPAQIKLVQAGYHIGIPNDGFVTKEIFVDGKKRYVLEMDSERGKYFYEMFEMRVNGYTDEEIVDAINKMGYRSPVRKKYNKDHTKIIGKTGGNKLTVKQLQKYICNPRYAGINIHKWTNYKPIRTKGGYIVTIEKFNKANKGKVFIKENMDGSVDVLYDYNPVKNVRKRLRNNPEFPIKTLVCCGECGKPFKGSRSTGKSGRRFSYYHCERGHMGVRYKKDDLEGKYYGTLDKLNFGDVNKSALLSALQETWSEHKKHHIAQSERIQDEIEACLAEKDRVVQKIIDTQSDVVAKALEESLEKIENKVKRMQKEKHHVMLQEGNLDEFVDFAVKLVEHPAKMMKMTEDVETKEVISTVFFAETPTHLDVFSGTPKTSVVYKLCESSRNEKSLNVVRRGIEPRLPG
jgi:site-specific DNA recombinase